MNFVMSNLVNSQIPEAEASVYIDDSSQALAERLELCMLRTDSYTGETVSPVLKGFFDTAFAILINAAGNQTSPVSELCKSADLMDQMLCKPNGPPAVMLCKPDISTAMNSCETEKFGDSILCKLMRFWILELEGLIPLEKGGSLTDLVICWETTLQLLLEAELAYEEKRLPEVKEWKDILYSYVYDYAADLISEKKERRAAGEPTGTSFITELAEQILEKKQESEDFLAGCPAQVRIGLEQFLGDRLKARLLELLPSVSNDRDVVVQTNDRDVVTHTKNVRQNDRDGVTHTKNVRQTTSLPYENRTTNNVPPVRIALSSHQMKTLSELLRKAGTMALMILMCLALCACGRNKKEEETEETTIAEAQEYPGMVSYKVPDSDQTEYFGVMHATVLDVQAGEKEGLFVYTLRDEEDPENAWCLNSQNVGSIFSDMTGGRRVAVLFYGDIANNPDGVEFIAILDDAPYQIKSAEGTATQNMINSFVVHTTKGKDLTFIKDNCKVDKEALSTDGSVSIRVYYADSNSGVLYPVRVYRQDASNR